MRSGLLAGIRWSVCMLKSHRSLCESFSRTGARLCIYHLFVWSNWNFLHISQWITLSTQSCLALYSFCANLLHSLIMWLIVSSLSPHSLHLLFCYYYYYYYYYYYCEFFTPVLVDSLSLESEWQQISSGLQDSSQYSSRSHQCCSEEYLDSSSDFQFSSLFSCPSKTITSSPTTIGITVTLYSTVSFYSLTRSKYLSFRFILFSFCGPPEQQNPRADKFFFLFINTRSDILAGIRWSISISKCLSYSRADSGLCIYHLVVWWNFSLLHNSLWITFPTQSCLIKYSFCDSWLHSLIIWWIVWFLSTRNLHLQFCCTLSIFSLL